MKYSLRLFIKLLPIIIFGALNTADAAKPNIVLIYVDDLPWYGTSVRMEAGNNGSYTPWQRTPNIQKLANQGVTFSRAFAPSGVCGPSRACMHLGQSSVRARYTGNTGTGSGLRFDSTGNVIVDEAPGYDQGKSSERLNEAISLSNIPRSNKSMGEAMKDLGYATAHFGKWHVYAGGPLRNGFDVTGNEPVHKGANKGDTNNDPGKSPKPSTDPKRVFSLTNQAINFMKGKANNNKPFFVVLSHYAAHDQSQYKPNTYKYYDTGKGGTKIKKALKNNKDIKKAKGHAAMVEDLDTSIGKLLNEIDRLKIKGNTYVVFTADNGKEWETGKNKLRGAKWWLWDDALRVPMIVRGPGIPANKRSNVSVCHYDFIPTFYDWGGGDLVDLPGYLDGVSLKNHCRAPGGNPSWSGRNLYFHYPHYRNSTPHSAIISGNRKVLWFYERKNNSGAYQPYFYNTAADEREANNLTPKSQANRDYANRKYAEFVQYANEVREDGYIFPVKNDRFSGGAAAYNPDKHTPPRK